MLLVLLLLVLLLATRSTALPTPSLGVKLTLPQRTHDSAEARAASTTTTSAVRKPANGSSSERLEPRVTSATSARLPTAMRGIVDASSDELARQVLLRLLLRKTRRLASHSAEEVGAHRRLLLLRWGLGVPECAEDLVEGARGWRRGRGRGRLRESVRWCER